METSGRTLVCSVLFLDIAGYSERPVSEQLALKEQLNHVLGAALEQVAPRDRVLVDTGDGAAVAFTGAPEEALFTAMAVRDAAQPISLRLGINLGPVRMMKDLNGKANIIGDGINAAQRVMSFATPGQLMVSRSFYEVVSCLSADYRKLFHYEGARTDKHVREHEVYSVVGEAVPVRHDAELTYRHLAHAASSGFSAAVRSIPRWVIALAATLVVAALLFVTARMQRSPEVERPAAAAPVELPQNKALASTPPPKTASPKPAAVPETASPKPAAPPKTARIEFAVAPWGEVWIDGKSRGASPPLRVVNVAPGRHTIEIRNTTFASRVDNVDLKPGESLVVRHKFSK